MISPARSDPTCHSVRYRITHRTEYHYGDVVAICQNQIRMIPRPFPGRSPRVTCHQVETTIEPEPDVCSEHTDYLGNRILSFAIESPHRQLIVTVKSEVTVEHVEPIVSHSEDTQSGAWDSVRDRVASGEDALWFESHEYLFDSARVKRGSGLAQYATESFRPGRFILEAALELTKRIHSDFRYDTTATDVETSSDQAFKLRAGVCQDFAHVQIACLRSIGIPARYVSGYLRTIPPPDGERLVGADESHAWISLYAGDSLGWVDFDPTNACVADTNHVPVCIGRDYGEVSPMRGVVIGGGAAQLIVSVDVEPIDSR